MLIMGAALTIGTPSIAQAQDTFALNTFEPSPAGDRFFGVQGPGGIGHLDLHLMALGDYGHAPLVLYYSSDEGKAGTLVSDQLFLHVGASFGLWERLLVSLDFPFALVNDSSAVTGAPEISSGAALGDLRVGARVRLLGEPAGPAQLALAGYVWLPTGDDSKLTGEGAVRGEPSLVAGGLIGAFVWSVNAGVAIRPSAEFAGTTLGPQLHFGVAAGALFAKDRLQLGPELYGSTVLAGEDSFSDTTTSAELMLGLRFRLGPMVLGGAGGPGLARGIGTPTARGMLSIVYAPVPTDRDHDGILDEADLCPEMFGAAATAASLHGCPPPLVVDRDGDGILDIEDACPDRPGIGTEDFGVNGCPDGDGDGVVDKLDVCPAAPGPPNEAPSKNGCAPVDPDSDGFEEDDDACPDVAGVASEDAAKNGCPPDKDGDGIADPSDACPAIKGPPSDDAAKNGCPPDTDGDGVRDDQDGCPRERGPRAPSPSKSGCPTKVRVASGRIDLLEPVQFKDKSDELLPESNELLAQLAGVLQDHPEIRRVLVEAHTEAKGDKKANQKLSDKRAARVKQWLVDNGTEASRVEAKGFGQDVAIADNKTDEGRARNRRVEIKVLEVGAPPPSPDAKVPADTKVPAETVPPDDAPAP